MLSANIVAFISCRSRLTIMLPSSARGEKRSGGGGGQGRLPDINTRRLKYELISSFKLVDDKVRHQGGC